MKKTCVGVVCVILQFTLSTTLHSARVDSRRVERAADLAKAAEAQLQTADSFEEYRQIAAQLEQAVDLNPKDFDSQRTLGWIYLDKLHDPHEAYPHLRIAAKGQPQNLDARKLLALASSQTGRTREAAREFEAASHLAPDDLWVRARLGREYAKLRRYDEAGVLYAEVLKADPANAEARLGQAELLAWQGQSRAPLDRLNQLVTEDPGNAEALTLRGDVLRWNWRLSEARDSYENAFAVVENHYGAKTGILEVERMGFSDVHGNGYYFKDNNDFERMSAGAGTRIHLADKIYLLADGAYWRFQNPGFEDVDRIDGSGGLEVNWSRWLQTRIQGGVFEYEDQSTEVSGRFSMKLSPTPNADFYGAAVYRQPFVSSMQTITSGLKEDLIGAGFDIRFGSRWSVQSALQLGRITDDNKWWQIKPQISYRLFGAPNRSATYVRIEYDYLSYDDRRTNYWTPETRHVASPVLDVSIPLGKGIRIAAVGKLPYVFDAEEFGWQAEGGPIIDIGSRVQLKASVIYASIPEDDDLSSTGFDQPPWSGYGGQLALTIRF
jgi:Flp pilus assembly protein TadD